MDQAPPTTDIKAYHKWVLERPDYFTTIRFRNRRYERQEHKTIKEAEQAAKYLVDADPTASIMIYAVRDNHDTFLKLVRHNGIFHTSPSLANKG